MNITEMKTTETNVLPFRETILVVEDYEPVRHVISVILRMRGYQVLTASCGQEAMELIWNYEGPLHLLITDVIMPGKNGRDLATQITRLHPETKVLFMSGYSDDIFCAKGVEFNSNTSFLQKPVSGTTLTNKISELLNTCDLEGR